MDALMLGPAARIRARLWPLVETSAGVVISGLSTHPKEELVPHHKRRVGLPQPRGRRVLGLGVTRRGLAIGTSMLAILATATPAGSAPGRCPLTTGQVRKLLHVPIHLYRPSAEVWCMFTRPGTPKGELQQARPLVAVVPFPDPDPSAPQTLREARHRLAGNPHLYPAPATWGPNAFIALYDGGPAYAFSHRVMTLFVPDDPSHASTGRMGLLRSLMTLEFRARPDLR